MRGLAGPSSVKLALNRAARYEPRGPRSAVNLETCAVLADDRLVPITIRNLSRDGFMGQTDAELDPDTWLGITLPGCGIVRARVRWNEDGELGCQFRRALDAAQLGKALSGELGGCEILGSAAPYSAPARGKTAISSRRSG